MQVKGGKRHDLCQGPERRLEPKHEASGCKAIGETLASVGKAQAGGTRQR
jgi:hypothetical protein